VKRNFLVVAANGQHREALATNLRSRGYTVTRAVSGREAKRVVRNVSFDTVLLESHLPDIDAQTLREQIQEIRPECRVIVVSGFDLVRNSPEQLDFDADDYLLDADQLLEIIHPSRDAGDPDASSLESKSNRSLIQVIDVLVGLIELDDRHFAGTSHNAMRLARELAERLVTDGEMVEEVTVAALLRDLGKVAVPHDLLDADGEYSEDQKQRMQEHVSASLRLFEHIDFPWKIVPIIRHHHERYDGAGYPDGLRGREIPIGARIVAVVDAFMALTSNRQHREAIDPEQALQELMQQAGRQFDPEVVEAFLQVVGREMIGRRGKGKPRVLIADPQEDFRKLLQMRLVNEGLEVETVSSCSDVMKLILKNPPDLILADVHSDRDEAFQLLQEMRESEQLARIPFAMLARRSDRVLRVRALCLGVDEYLSKADDLDEIVPRVQNVLTREALRRGGKPRRPRRGITGDLENLSLPDILQTLVMGMKTAKVSLTAGERSGQLWFEDGAVKHATSGKDEGEPAFYSMVGWDEGEFVIEHGIRPKKTTLKQDTMFLLMEGMRLLDETRRGSTQAAS